MLSRFQSKPFIEKIQVNKLVVLTGPKGVGKADFLQTCFEQIKQSPLFFDCSDKVQKATLTNKTLQAYKSLFGVRPYVVIHEAQYLENLGAIIEFILSGDLKNTLVLSCSFQPKIDDLLWEVIQMQELEVQLFPYTFYELANHFGLPNEEKNIEERLIYGQYPTVLATPAEAKNLLDDQIQHFLKRQLGLNERINKTDKLMRVLQYLAFKIGQPISYNEVGVECGVDNETVERYIALFEKAYILFKIPAFHTEKRYELKKTQVIYFYDCGIRNALIQNFNPMSLRFDKNELWKNWLISERLKWLSANAKKPQYAFWKTHTSQEMDYVEMDDQNTKAYKCLWDKSKKVKIPALFESYYPQIKTSVLNKSTYWSFLTKK